MNRISSIAVRFLKITLAVCVVCLGTSASAFAELVVYPDPGPPVRASSMYEVNVIQDGVAQTSFVYQIDAQKTQNWRHNVASFTTFSFSGEVTVEVSKLTGAYVSECGVYPSSYGIEPEIVTDRMIRFSIDRPMKKMAVVFNDDWTTHPLFLFADPLEDPVPSPGDRSVIYFGPGVHEAGVIRPLSDQTVYIAGGAWVKGCIESHETQRVTIRGRGVLSGEDYAHREHHMIHLEGWNRKEALVEGITIVQSPHYCVQLDGQDSVVRNVKMFTWYFNGDGARVGRDGIVEDCFFRVNDDALKLYFGDEVARRCVFWQMENGAVFQISWNMPGDHANFHVYDSDIIRTEHQWDNPNLGIIVATHRGSAHMHGYLFEDIRVENARNRLFNIHMLRGPKHYDIDRGNGEISDIVIRNFTATHCDLWRQNIIAGIAGNPARSQDAGVTYYTHDITFENLRINGQLIEDAHSGNFDIDPDTTYNIQFVLKRWQWPTVHYEFEGDALDTVGDNHGLISGATFVPGQVGSLAAHFDGIDDYIEIPCITHDDFTIAFWVRTASTGGSGSWSAGDGLVDGMDTHSREDFGTALVGGKFGFGVGLIAVARADDTIISSTDINDDQWHHVAATRDATTGEMKIYVDGVEEATAVGSTGPKDTSSALRVGCLRPGLNFFEGDIDDLCLYNYVLSATELEPLGYPNLDDYAFYPYGGVEALPFTLPHNMNHIDSIADQWQGDWLRDASHFDQVSDTVASFLSAENGDIGKTCFTGGVSGSFTIASNYPRNCVELQMDTSIHKSFKWNRSPHAFENAAKAKFYYTLAFADTGRYNFVLRQRAGTTNRYGVKLLNFNDFSSTNVFKDLSFNGSGIDLGTIGSLSTDGSSQYVAKSKTNDPAIIHQKNTIWVMVLDTVEITKAPAKYVLEVSQLRGGNGNSFAGFTFLQVSDEGPSRP